MSQHSPLHTAISNGESLSAIQQAYEQDPSKLTKDILLEAVCTNATQVGVVRFLADKLNTTEWEEIFREASERIFHFGSDSKAAITELSFHFEEEQSQATRLGFIELMKFLPHLQKLVLFDICDAEGHFCRTIANLIRDGQLKELRIAFDHQHTPSQDALQTLLDALASSPHMKNLWLFLGQSSSQTKTLCLSRLVQMLQHHNSPLEKVVLDFPGKYNEEQLHLKQQLRYQAALNMAGRQTIRQPNATVSDLVEVLHSASSRRAAVSVGSVLFGLLRESPALWSTASCCDEGHITVETPLSTRKRASIALTDEGPSCKTMKLP